MQPVTVPTIPLKYRLEHHHPETVACLLLGGRAQTATIEMSFEIAAFYAAQLTAVALIDPFAPPPHLPFSQGLWLWVENVDLTVMRDAAKLSIEQFDAHGCEKALRVSRIVGASVARGLIGRAAEADLVLVPANVRIDGSWAEVWSEVAEFLVQRSHTPVLRVSRRPLEVTKVVLVVSSTGRCSQLASKYLELGLWPEARVSVLPIGDYRPRVSENVGAQLDLLRASGRDPGLLPAIDLDFEAAELERMLSPFQAAVVGHLSYRAGWFDSLRSDPFEITASYVPMVLIP